MSTADGVRLAARLDEPVGTATPQLHLEDEVTLEATLRVQYTAKRGDYVYAMPTYGRSIGEVPDNFEMAKIDLMALEPYEFLDLGNVEVSVVPV